jgi:hypothetical protein
MLKVMLSKTEKLLFKFGILKRKMELVPVSRSTLLGLKAKKEEEERIQMIGSIIYNIFNEVMRIAKTTTNTTYKIPIQDMIRRNLKIEDNIPDILDRLRNLFPDSKVELKDISRHLHGNTYDQQEYIIVDWSL